MTTGGEVLIYDAQGIRVKAMVLPAEVSAGRDPPDGDGKDNDSDDEGKGEGKESNGDDGVGSGAGRGGGPGGRGRVVSIDWYDGAEGMLHPQMPTLCIAFERGTVQMSRGVDDANPNVISTHMMIRQVRNYAAVGCWKDMLLCTSRRWLKYAHVYYVHLRA